MFFITQCHFCSYFNGCFWWSQTAVQSVTVWKRRSTLLFVCSVFKCQLNQNYNRHLSCWPSVVLSYTKCLGLVHQGLWDFCSTPVQQRWTEHSLWCSDQGECPSIVLERQQPLPMQKCWHMNQNSLQGQAARGLKRANVFLYCGWTDL